MKNLLFNYVKQKYFSPGGFLGQSLPCTTSSPGNIRPDYHNLPQHQHHQHSTPPPPPLPPLQGPELQTPPLPIVGKWTLWDLCKFVKVSDYLVFMSAEIYYVKAFPKSEYIVQYYFPHNRLTLYNVFFSSNKTHIILTLFN